MKNVKAISTACGFLAAACLVVGCSHKKKGESLTAEKAHILKLAGLYGLYKTSHGGKAPRTTEEFTKWARSLPKDRLKNLGIEDLDEALVSPRDHEPYQVTAGKPNRMGISGVVIYEKTGVRGRHQVLGTMGNTGEESEEQLRQSVPHYGS